MAIILITRPWLTGYDSISSRHASFIHDGNQQDSCYHMFCESSLPTGLSTLMSDQRKTSIQEIWWSARKRWMTSQWLSDTHPCLSLSLPNLCLDYGTQLQSIHLHRFTTWLSSVQKRPSYLPYYIDYGGVFLNQIIPSSFLLIVRQSRVNKLFTLKTLNFSYLCYLMFLVTILGEICFGCALGQPSEKYAFNVGGFYNRKPTYLQLKTNL